ncbi:competence type IV pilus minor pilin ComGD [Jeotgalibaca ciconiae]|uniref:Prepilin-type N-terminal cleavage/methylation domain-containing protein n=1 Tax=Jeotgalibaca ciconiae TaxID=2496265 RepID=A0A3S9HDT2_9LACT|nr:competence type IV pilus minor pilin ComGD [Jeotgalibaca ciconiae]AZP05504.1 prepilin-type N-terminal cleavage/methylation domain-containing protein [Jeotgalibaca ciconiae]
MLEDNKRLRKNGFTLFESLLVLFILSIVLLLSTPISQFSTDNYSMRLFVDDFLTEIEKAQNYAVIQNKPVKVEMRTINGETSIHFYVESSNPYFKDDVLSVPEGVASDTNQNFWIKSESGYIQPRTIQFSTEKLTTKITVQMGMGRYRVEEIKR